MSHKCPICDSPVMPADDGQPCSVGCRVQYHEREGSLEDYVSALENDVHTLLAVGKAARNLWVSCSDGGGYGEQSYGEDEREKLYDALLKAGFFEP
jgi:hypothetical protein